MRFDQYDNKATADFDEIRCEFSGKPPFVQVLPIPKQCGVFPAK
jgi:hypothetical protein